MKEYKVIYTGWEGKGSVEDFLARNSSSGLENELNRHAAQGWRLVSVTRTLGDGNTFEHYLFLERDKAD